MTTSEARVPSGFYIASGCSCVTSVSFTRFDFHVSLSTSDCFFSEAFSGAQCLVAIAALFPFSYNWMWHFRTPVLPILPFCHFTLESWRPDCLNFSLSHPDNVLFSSDCCTDLLTGCLKIEMETLEWEILRTYVRFFQVSRGRFCWSWLRCLFMTFSCFHFKHCGEYIQHLTCPVFASCQMPEGVLNSHQNIQMS